MTDHHPRAAAILLCVSACLPGIAAGETRRPTPTVAEDFVRAEPAEPLPPPAAAALAGLTASALAAHIRLLASPAFEGRGLASRGLEAAAEYVAAALALAGIPPLENAGGSQEKADYFQQVPLRELSGFTGQVTVERRSGEATWSRSFFAGVDCLFAEQAPHSLTAPVVFAGYGIREEKLGRDDYRGLDVRGRIVLVLAGVPGGEPWQRPELLARYASPEARKRWDAKLETARALGAAAVLGVEGDDFAVRDLAREHPEARFFLAYDAPAADQAIALVRVSAAAADALLAAGDLDHASARTAQPRTLSGVTATIRVNGTERLVASRNVVGFIAGSDQKLREEAIVIGAHMDHLGRVDDVVYPGADDNASGVSALIEIAKALAALPTKPKRTVVIAFWTGEEEGKFGSGFYVRHPLWSLAHTAAYLNLDMIGHPWSMDEIRKLVADTGLPAGDAFLAKVKPADFVEPGLPPDAPELEAALRHAGHATGLALHFDRTDGTHGGSDYRDFARAHVPFIRFFGNFFPAYHQPGDTPDQLDATQVQRMARLAFVTAWLLADR
jgi:hypothetical protein